MWLKTFLTGTDSSVLYRILADFSKKYAKIKLIKRPQACVWRRFINLTVIIFFTRIMLRNFAAV